ncbi:hypothetical protein [Streptomyces sp. NPDC017941]|uniref:hypothetical protein n=1 Tax=Streptomyces sp. NPDC017941 TaxID=3365018 RepID=UPI00379333E3
MATAPVPHITVPTSAPTVWLATSDGLVVVDMIAVDLAVNGGRRGWMLTRDEMRYAAGLMVDRKIPYSTVVKRLGVSTDRLREWFPEYVVPQQPGMARPGQRRPNSCGTRRGYQAHTKRGQDPCGRCRAANTLADRHYRTHGTYVGAPGVAA